MAGKPRGALQQSLLQGKNSFPGGHWGLYHSGNEAYAPYNANTTPAARGHITQGSGYFGGPALMDPLLAALRGKANVTVQTYACA